ncbi:hypothetical protein TNCV_1638811 [Trichonephila clavipes]|nr:hypothetical protein TNCV_1638811 [Trichonephila clavipes]
MASFWVINHYPTNVGRVDEETVSLQKFKLALLSKMATDLTAVKRFIRLVWQFIQNDHQARRRFVEWAQNEIAVVPYFHKRILFSDEAHFWLNGYINKQNCHIWNEANPQVSPPGGAAAYQLLHRSINRQIANVVAKNYGNLALSPTFRSVSIESPL